jgi:hypothetical protein
MLRNADWTALPLNMGRIDFPETSVANYPSKLRNIPEELRVHRVTYISQLSYTDLLPLCYFSGHLLYLTGS